MTHAPDHQQYDSFSPTKPVVYTRYASGALDSEETVDATLEAVHDNLPLSFTDKVYIFLSGVAIVGAYAMIFWPK